ncbi:MAG: SAM-dependent chlorinase/fluorinase [Thermofilaceae archaeon]
MDKRPVITLLTGFGYKDHYVAAVKGVILSICPEANITDITHNIPKFDILTA